MGVVGSFDFSIEGVGTSLRAKPARRDSEGLVAASRALIVSVLDGANDLPRGLSLLSRLARSGREPDRGGRSLAFSSFPISRA